jgi:glycosyltransferase involved in cell wall biosynthesis
MQVAILTHDDYPSFHKPMAESLSKMLSVLGINNEIFFESTFALTLEHQSLKLDDLIENLKKFDAIFICAHMPGSLAKNEYQGVDRLKAVLSAPIINYDLCFWATRGSWIDRIRTESEYDGFAGFNRFDFYVVVSNISELPIKEGVSWPVVVIGGDFRNHELYPDQDDFRALMDFERSEFNQERHVQLKVLQKLKIPYTVLSCSYSHKDIYRIYRKHSVYFLAHRESFGLPIVEVQNCGCCIFTPYKNWAPSHYINKSPYDRGEGDLNKNFVVYNNDPQRLEQELIELRRIYSSDLVIREFESKNSDLRKGNLENLADVMTMIKLGKINCRSGLNYNGLEDQIITS